MKKSKLVGIDISHHNELYHAAMGWDFVIHKMSEGVGHIDDQLPEMLVKRNEYGIRLFGVYHYVTRSAAERQAKFVKDLFENYARSWMQKQRPEAIKTEVQVDVHAPQPTRVNIPVQCQDDFYTAFDVKPSDGMWLDPDERITIW